MQPEKLSWWDRLFNRFRREIIETFEEPWYRYNTITGQRKGEFTRTVTKYRVIDRVTGSERIEIQYHN